SGAALDRLRAHHWPGNVRELENLMERLLIHGDEGPITVEEIAELLPSAGVSVVAPDAPILSAAKAAASAAGGFSLPEQERRFLVEALERCRQNQTRAAALLKISREQLRTRMKRYGLLPQQSS
ncbi:MAG: sigma-54-dependent Fis family transcriptional regulator, partial [Acidobacteria bacterium]